MGLRIVCVVCALTVFVVAGNVLPAQQNPASGTEPGTSPPSRIRLSADVAERQLSDRIDPVYPPIAKTAKVSGTVTLHVIIGKDGAVQHVEAISGPPLLLTSAIDAVKQWRYTPTLLNGQPLEVDTTVSVVFSLSDGPQSNQSVTNMVDPQFRADVMKLLEVIHYRELSTRVALQSFESARAQTERSFPDVPNKEALIDAYRDKMLALLRSAEFDDLIVSVYAKYLSDAEVRSLVQFYETPMGQHYSAVEVDLSNDLGQAGIQLGREHIAEIHKEFCGEHPALQGKISFCPAKSGDSSANH